ncbi:MAG: hypothetical protein WAN04_12715, partial [Candidatus Udaeobacter sp.]
MAQCAGLALAPLPARRADPVDVVLGVLVPLRTVGLGRLLGSPALAKTGVSVVHPVVLLMTAAAHRDVVLGVLAVPA